MYCNRDINLMEASKEFFTEIVVMLQTSNMKEYLQLLGEVCEEERNILYVIKKTT